MMQGDEADGGGGGGAAGEDGLPGKLLFFLAS